MPILIKTISFLSKKERTKAIKLLILILIMAFLDVAGVASIMPFIAVLADPSIIDSNYFLSQIYTKINFSDYHSFMFFLGAMVFLLLSVSIAFKAFTIYKQINFVQVLEYRISSRLVEGYVNQPYSWFLNRHSADLGKNILSEVGGVTSGALMPIMTIISQGIVSAALILLLMIVDLNVALISGSIITLSYVAIYKLSSVYLDKIGAERRRVNQLRFISVIDVFGAIKDVKVRGLEQSYCNNFKDPAKKYASYQSSAQIVSQIPRFVLEALTFGGMILLILYLLSINSELDKILPLISIYALAGYRLMPSLQQVYSGFSQIRYSAPGVRALYYDISSLDKNYDNLNGNPIVFNSDIRLKNIEFKYNKSDKPSLKNINISINAFSKVGIVGHTGSGKTTLVDLILGLLKPSYGSIEVDGLTIDGSNIRQWQKIIGYVPQQIYLSDDTIYANIAFGVSADKINKKNVEKVSRIANLHNFVTSDLPDGYNTSVGERGMRLSGGQRQRIGIARALYHNPKILIMDEATSALDGVTEKAVMDAVHNLTHKITIVLIAHRLTTVQECDQIYMMHKGSVSDYGTYSELLNKNDVFQKMANNASSSI